MRDECGDNSIEDSSLNQEMAENIIDLRSMELQYDFSLDIYRQKLEFKAYKTCNLSILGRSGISLYRPSITTLGR